MDVVMATKNVKTRERLTKALRQLYQHRSEVLHQDRELFYDSVEEHLQANNTQLQEWIVHNKKLILHSVRTAQSKSATHTNDIKNFFRKKIRTLRSKIEKSSGKFQRVLKKMYSTGLNQHFPQVPPSKSILPYIPENAPLPQSHLIATNSTLANKPFRPHPRVIQQTLFDLFPDHPG
jgi:hypothetical protein